MIPAIVFLLSLSLTCAAAIYFYKLAREYDHQRFDAATRDAESRIAARFDVYATVLRGAAGLFTASEQVNKDEFAKFIGNFDVTRRFAGIQGIGYAAVAEPDKIDDLRRQMNAQGYADYHIQRDDKRDLYSSVLFLEPLDERNQRAIGFDMFTEERRRRAMERARDTGEYAASGKVTLVQETDVNKQAGFLVYLPIYHGSVIPKTVEERRKLLKGFVYAPFRVEDLLHGILADTEKSELNFQIYDGEERTERRLLFSQANLESDFHPQFSVTRFVDIAGRRWMVDFQERTIFAGKSETRFVPMILFIGLLFSLILLWISHSQVRERMRAEDNAAQLRQSEAEVRDLNDNLEKMVEARTLQLVESNKELESFSYSVSHDLRAPLRHISGFADLLNKRLAAHTDETAHRYLKNIRDAARQAGVLVDDLLGFSRMSRTELTRTTVNMNALITEVRHGLQLDTANRTVEWRIEDLPAVIGDAAMLRLVWQNLISNAIKYTSKKAVGIIEIKCLIESDRYVFSVGDNGVGFDMQYVNKLFGVFQRLHSHEEFEGTGIGLANVRRIIERHGGKTWAEGEPDNGATVFFTLPKTSQQGGDRQ